MISFWTSLNSGVPAALAELEQRRLDGGDDRAGPLQARAAPTSRSCGVARADGVGDDVDLDAAVEQVERRSAMTQTCASIPQTSAWSRPSRSKPSARDRR